MTEPGTDEYAALREQLRTALRRTVNEDENVLLDLRSSISSFTKSRGITASNSEEVKDIIRTAPSGFPASTMKTVYSLLRQHTCCTCSSEIVQMSQEIRHLVKLLLEPIGRGNPCTVARFEMLISSVSARDDYPETSQSRKPWHSQQAAHIQQLGYWEDVELLARR